MALSVAHDRKRDVFVFVVVFVGTRAVLRSSFSECILPAQYVYIGPVKTHFTKTKLTTQFRNFENLGALGACFVFVNTLGR